MSFPTSDNPYEAPQAEGFGPEGPIEVPPGFVGKLLMGLSLLLRNLRVIAPIVLTVWLPAHFLIESVMAQSATPNDVLATIKLDNLVAAFFDPLIAGAILCVLAERMEGRRVTYRSAMGVGLQNWGRLFGARLVSGLLIVLGLIALVVPGIVMAVRYALIDEAVVLEGEGISSSRARSANLVEGRWGLIFLSGVVSFSILMAIAIGLGVLIEEVPALNNIAGNVGIQCFVNVLSIHITCVLFLYYWERRAIEGLLPDMKPLKNIDFDDIDGFKRKLALTESNALGT